MACKMMIGQDLYDDTKPNMTLLQQKVRQKNKEKPSGRKASRKKDYGKIATKIGKFSIHSYLLMFMYVSTNYFFHRAQ